MIIGDRDCEIVCLNYRVRLVEEDSDDFLQENCNKPKN